MQSAIHALGWGTQRLAIAVGLALFVALLAYATLVIVLVVVQAFATWN